MNKDAWDELIRLEEEFEKEHGYNPFTIGPALAPVCKVCGKRTWRPKSLESSMCKCPKKENKEQA